jgi:hypothetical protein
VRCMWFCTSAILLLVFTIISVFPKSHPLSITCSTSANPNLERQQAIRMERETRKKQQNKRKPGPKTHSIQRSTVVSSIYIPSRLESVLIVMFTIGADCPKSRTPRSYLRPGLSRWYSRSCDL